MLSNQKPSSEKLGLGISSLEASSSGTKEIKFVKAQKKASSDGGPINMGGPHIVQAAPKIIMGPPAAMPGSEKSVSFQKSILGPRPKHIIVNNVKVPIASDNEVKQFYKPLSKPEVGFSKPNFRSKTPPYRRVNNNYPRPKTPQPKRNVGRQNQPCGFPLYFCCFLLPALAYSNMKWKQKLETLGSDFEHRNINTELQLGNMNNGVPFCDAQLLDESCDFYEVHDVGGVCPVGSGSVGSMTILDFGNSEVHSVSGQKAGGLFSLGSNIGGGQMVLDFKNTVSHFPCDENHFNKVDGFNDGAWFGLNVATHLFLMIRTIVSFGNMEVFGLKGSPPQAVLVGNEEMGLLLAPLGRRENVRLNILRLTISPKIVWQISQGYALGLLLTACELDDVQQVFVNGMCPDDDLIDLLALDSISAFWF
ncbi:hypothetical protein Tco_0024498 [Tanacetum coccineum]